MLMIDQGTEQKLLQELKTCWESLPAHRCLHLKFSKFEERKEKWIDHVLQALRHVFDDQSARIYICQDQDIFVLTRYMTHKRIEDFLAHLSPKLPPALQANIGPELAALFEIGVDWPRLRALCEKKIENIALQKNLQKERKQENLAKVSKEEAIKTINQDLISTLSKRRAQRDKTEIMIVEDDPFSQKLVASALKERHQLSIAGDGQGAIMGYVHKAPDVLFLDIGLPDMNGHEVLERLFKLDPDAYVVMFSGNGDKENVIKAVDLGAKGFVGKPFTQEKLLQYIQKSPFIQEKQNREKPHGNFVN